MDEIAKLKRGNRLSLLFQELFQKRVEMLRLRMTPIKTMGFLGQHTNSLRQEKNRVMREMGFTGKQYRNHIKLQRRQAKAAEACAS